MEVRMWFSLLWSVAAVAHEPSVSLRWKRDETALSVLPPVGEHVAEEAPFYLQLGDGVRSLELSGDGAELRDGIEVGATRGRTLEGHLTLSLCEDGGTRCRIAEVHFDGVVPMEPRGGLTLASRAEEAGESTFPAQVDANAAFAAAKAHAEREHKPIVIDFGAVWCPPCNQLAAEVLDAPDRPAVLARVVPVVVDVDDPSSWPLKDQHHVGGYPTLVAVDVEGRELGRLVGYPGREETVAWLTEIASGGSAQAGTDATRAWAAVRAGDLAAARALIPSAERAADSVELHLARFVVEPNLADARWLTERAQGRAIDWVPSSISLAQRDPVAREVVLRAVSDDVASADPVEAANLIATQAEITGGEAGRLLYAAAASLLRARLTGDARQDKGYYSDLAWLLEHAGQPEDALAELERARGAWPDEPTFHAAIARSLLKLNRPAEALVAADQALAVAWGDNRLTAAILKARALVALGRTDDARAYVLEVLADTPTPAAELKVRTGRYIQELKDVVPPR
jgi:thioredoxin-like negative regulator of GroEL